MKKFIYFIFLNLIVLFILQYAIGSYFDMVYKKSSMFKTNIIYNKSYNIANMDVLILGGSRGLTSINSQLLSQKNNKKVFNLATDDTQLPIHLMQLKMLINRNIKPKVILLDLLNTEGYNHNALRFMPLIGDKEVDEYFTFFNGKTWLLMQKIFPIYKYSYFNVELFYPLFIVLKNHTYQYRSDEFGDFYYPNSNTKLPTKEITNYKLQESKYYDDFKNICSINGIKLITIVPPFYKTNVIVPYNDVWNFASMFNTNVDYFYDIMHINNKGREVFTNFLSDSLNYYIQ